VRTLSNDAGILRPTNRNSRYYNSYHIYLLLLHSSIYWCIHARIIKSSNVKCVALLLAGAFVFSPRPTHAAPVCWLGSVPCFLACGNPPSLTDADQAALWLRPGEYQEVNWFDQGSAAVTTQFFKCIGINGWKRYGFYVYAAGTVKQAATSWDGLRTVDMVLADFNGSQIYRSLPATHYIRAEVIRRVWKHLSYPVCPGDQIRVEGELHWDGHGFLEIHPAKDADLKFVSAPTHLKKCPASN
jgi:hypothetical protein